MDQSEQLNMRRGPEAPAGGSHGGSQGSLWQRVKANPHAVILVLVGIATLYVTYKIYQAATGGNSSSSSVVPSTGAGSPNWLTALTGGSSAGSTSATPTDTSGTGSATSGGGSTSGGTGFPFQPILLPALHVSTQPVSAANPNADAPSWYTSAGQRVKDLAALFHVAPSDLEYNPNNAALFQGVDYHQWGDMVIPAGQQVWITRSRIPAGYVPANLAPSSSSSSSSSSSGSGG